MPIQLTKSNFALGAMLAATLCVASASGVRAEAKVSGTKDAMVLEANNASMQEIIAALNTSLNIQVTSAVTLDRPVTGRYSGSLRRVLLRILDGRNFILSSSGNQISILMAAPGVVTARAPVNLAPPPQARPVESTSVYASATEDAEQEKSGVQGWSGFFSIKK